MAFGVAITIQLAGYCLHLSSLNLTNEQYIQRSMYIQLRKSRSLRSLQLEYKVHSFSCIGYNYSFVYVRVCVFVCKLYTDDLGALLFLGCT